jgi:Xaa-Pro aminopeptidase
MGARGLDVVLAYSDRHTSFAARALTGATCRSAGNYLVVTPTELYFAEVSYKVADLISRTSVPVVSVSDENLYAEFFADKGRNWRNVGVVGPVPYAHMIPFRGQIVDLTVDVCALLHGKSQEEIHSIQDAYLHLKRIVDSACHDIPSGMTEQALAELLKVELARCSDRLGFDPLITSGARLEKSTFLSPSDRRLEVGDYVCIDLGTVTNGLYTDITKVFRVGLPDDPAVCALHQLQRDVVAQLEVNMPVRELADIYRHAARRFGLEPSSIPVEDLGHFIGFQLHEPPFFVTPESEGVLLSEGCVFCLEPQVTINGARLRTEDMVLMWHGRGVVLENWHEEQLGSSSLDPQRIGS